MFLGKNRGSKNGFTVLEMIFYIAMLSGILVVISGFLLWAARAQTKAVVEKETLDASKRALEIIVSETREAKYLYEPTSLFGQDSGQLSLATSKYLPSDENISYIDFYLCGQYLCFKKENQNPQALTSDRVEITKLKFSKVATSASNPSVQIEIQVDFKNPSGKPEYQSRTNLVSTASLRSY